MAIPASVYRKGVIIAAVSVLTLCMAAIAIIVWFNRYLETPVIASSEQAAGDIVFTIEPGSGMNQIAAELTVESGLKWPGLYSLWVRYLGLDRQIQAGEYRIEQNMTPREIVDLFISGKHIQYPVQFIEGWTVDQALAALWATDTVEATLQGLSHDEIKERLGITFPALEGSFFPDTYFHTRGTTDQQILRQASNRLTTLLNEAWQERAENLPLNSPWDAMILASVIEREAGNHAEKADIAGVFVRRLQQGMRLQSDPTVIYGMGERYQGNIRRQDLREETPWNTYRINGLPPTPIALAGYESIVAALHPADGDSLYFVSRGDGSHQFSATLEAHNKAVNQYIRNQNDSQ